MEETIKGAYRSKKPLVISLKQARFDYYKTTPTGVKTARYITALETALETARGIRKVYADYKAKCDKLDADYVAECDKLDADYDAKCDKLDADYDAKRAPLYADYKAKRAPLYADYKAKCDKLDADYKAKREAVAERTW